jgi:hypothetical protein
MPLPLVVTRRRPSGRALILDDAAALSRRVAYAQRLSVRTAELDYATSSTGKISPAVMTSTGICSIGSFPQKTTSCRNTRTFPQHLGPVRVRPNEADASICKPNFSAGMRPRSTIASRARRLRTHLQYSRGAAAHRNGEHWRWKLGRYKF